jgi:hypothetical protein
MYGKKRNKYKFAARKFWQLKKIWDARLWVAVRNVMDKTIERQVLNDLTTHCQSRVCNTKSFNAN